MVLLLIEMDGKLFQKMFTLSPLHDQGKLLSLTDRLIDITLDRIFNVFPFLLLLLDEKKDPFLVLTLFFMKTFQFQPQGFLECFLTFNFYLR